MHEETPKLSDISECVCLNDSLSDVPVCPQRRGHAALDLLAEPISLTLKFKTSISPLFSLVLKNVQVNFVRRPDWDTDLDTEGKIDGRKSGWATGLPPPCSEQTRAWELEGRWLRAAIDSATHSVIAGIDDIRFPNLSFLIFKMGLISAAWKECHEIRMQ
ncbi:hypothetical protein MJT46_011777 [Ovis ammon polii x Ovis aries]|nr:hypothetical protein MJT46_011777 [Ovis ammon polii x Ovis aries]